MMLYLFMLQAAYAMHVPLVNYCSDSSPYNSDDGPFGDMPNYRQYCDSPNEHQPSHLGSFFSHDGYAQQRHGYEHAGFTGQQPIATKPNIKHTLSCSHKVTLEPKPGRPHDSYGGRYGDGASIGKRHHSKACCSAGKRHKGSSEKCCPETKDKAIVIPQSVAHSSQSHHPSVPIISPSSLQSLAPSSSSDKRKLKECLEELNRLKARREKRREGWPDKKEHLDDDDDSDDGGERGGRTAKRKRKPAKIKRKRLDDPDEDEDDEEERAKKTTKRAMRKRPFARLRKWFAGKKNKRKSKAARSDDEDEDDHYDDRHSLNYERDDDSDDDDDDDGKKHSERGWTKRKSRGKRGKEGKGKKRKSIKGGLLPAAAGAGVVAAALPALIDAVRKSQEKKSVPQGEQGAQEKGAGGFLKKLFGKKDNKKPREGAEENANGDDSLKETFDAAQTTGEPEGKGIPAQPVPLQSDAKEALYRERQISAIEKEASPPAPTTVAQPQVVLVPVVSPTSPAPTPPPPPPPPPSYVNDALRRVKKLSLKSSPKIKKNEIEERKDDDDDEKIRTESLAKVTPQTPDTKPN